MSKVVFVGNVPYNMGEDALIDVFKSVGQVIGFRLVFDRDTGKPKGYGFCEFAGTLLYSPGLCIRACLTQALYSNHQTQPTRNPQTVHGNLRTVHAIVKPMHATVFQHPRKSLQYASFIFWLIYSSEYVRPRSIYFVQTQDHETAASAVRNLNNTDVGGRPLRIDLADSDPFLEGKTTVRGELMDGGAPGPAEPRTQWRTSSDGRSNEGRDILAAVPAGTPLPPGETAQEAITRTLANGMSENDLIEVLAR
ncbi:hypothetical protein B0H10DRAFT_215055 [Mycena sp. CBHHK59/15]|nr:hypothetical protein B0H10DRAFT_215055 [Mycena sp. CBHHK59/15]